jgi:hypothetical protein
VIVHTVELRRLQGNSPRRCLPNAARLALLFLFVVAQHAVLQGAPTPRASQTQQKSSALRGSTTSRDLHKIGETLAKAVLDKNIETLLGFDRADLRSADSVSLKNPKSDLYCYLFDSNCITWGDGSWRSVYDKLSQAHQLEIKVSVSSSRYDRQLYGNLFFYDASAVSDKNLHSRDFLCKEGPANIATWKFRLEGGKWKSVNPLFDSETWDCPNSPQEDAK